MNTNSFINEKLEIARDLVQTTSSNIFLTGNAGTGKTTFLRQLQADSLKRKIVVAPTGVAAINAGGVTIHSFFQLPLGPHLPESQRRSGDNRLGKRVAKLNKNKINIMRSLELLIIDEISMVRADVLDAVDEVLRRVRRSKKPFGGVQLLMIGDVHQLAPVAKPEEWELLRLYYDSVYFFSSHALSSAGYTSVELDHIYRQSDPNFIKLLNKVRCNDLNASDVAKLNSRFNPNFNPSDEEGYITLTTHNYQADDINESKLAALKTPTICFKAKIIGNFPENDYPTKKELELKVGARVMFIKNDPNPGKLYYNGKIGTITSYNTDSHKLTVKCNDEDITVGPLEWENNEYVINPETNEIEENKIGSFIQIPLRLAWAVTIHKSQGLTFDKVIIDAAQAFAHGQVYVALSRSTTLEGIVLKTKISPNVLVNDDSVDDFCNALPEHTITNNGLKNLQHEYQYSVMTELYDFDAISGLIERLSWLVKSNKNIFDAATVNEMPLLYYSFIEKIVEVAHKFAFQIKKLHDSTATDYTENKALQKRLSNANDYFLPELKSIHSKMETIGLVTDNKEINKQVKDMLGQLLSDIKVKIKVLETCATVFSIEKYQKAKFDAIIDVDKRVAVGQGKVAGNSLVTKLRRWRDAQAETENVPQAAVLPYKALVAIAEEKPLTIKDLLEIPKMGKKRVAMYGVTIIRLVSEHEGVEVSPGIDHEASQLVINTYERTRQMIEEGMSIEQVAAERNLAVSTIEGHLAKLIGRGVYTVDMFVDTETYKAIYNYFYINDEASPAEAQRDLEVYSFGVVKMVYEQMKYDNILNSEG